MEASCSSSTGFIGFTENSVFEGLQLKVNEEYVLFSTQDVTDSLSSGTIDVSCTINDVYSSYIYFNLQNSGGNAFGYDCATNQVCKIVHDPWISDSLVNDTQSIITPVETDGAAGNTFEWRLFFSLFFIVAKMII